MNTYCANHAHTDTRTTKNKTETKITKHSRIVQKCQVRAKILQGPSHPVDAVCHDPLGVANLLIYGPILILDVRY